MKCPKCDYLGFETGDRCRNCGYDFSLLVSPVAEPGDLSLDTPVSEAVSVGDLWLDRSPDARHEEYPLFAPDEAGDDEPLIKLPAEPRAPLAVRRTPDLSRSRPSRAPRKVEMGLTLEFAEETPSPPPVAQSVPVAEVRAVESPIDPNPVTGVATLGSRALAAGIDHAILFGIDLVVIYGTLKMTALSLDEWQALPAAPLLAFLVLLKLSYFSAFTAVGGQTIGKMAAGIRVVADEDRQLDPARAIGRTLTGALSLLSLGLGMIPAFVGQERRAFHDRIAHTRVVDLPSA